MLREEIENAFVRSLQIYDPVKPRSIESRFLEQLTPETRSRMLVYQTSYINRLVETHSETTLERLSELAGEDRVRLVLLDYFRDLPPAGVLLSNVLDGLPSYLQDHRVKKEVPYFIDMVRLGLLHAQVLVGADPKSEDIVSIDADRLGQTFFVDNIGTISSEFPLFDLWEAGDPQEDRNEDVFIASEAQTVLVYRSSAFDTHVVRVPSVLIEFVRTMTQGESLGAALSALDIEEDELPILQEFIANLTATRAFTCKS